MAMSAPVDRHTIDEGSEISTVIEVEATQEILIGLAAARMLGGDEARDDLEQFADALDRSGFEIDLADDAFRRRPVTMISAAAASASAACAAPLAAPTIARKSNFARNACIGHPATFYKIEPAKIRRVRTTVSGRCIAVMISGTVDWADSAIATFDRNPSAAWIRSRWLWQ